MDEAIQKPSLTPKYFFISLAVLGTLITSVSSFLILFFETLNKKFPDALNSTYQYGYSSYNYESLRGTLATLIIVFPVFLVLSYFWRKLSKNELGKGDSLIFKWMIYMVIFLAGVVVIVDLVTLVKYFVAGEITTRFIFKVLGTIVVAVLVGLNYFSELRNNKNKILFIIYSIISVLIFIGIIIWSFMVMGSPQKQRAWRLDDRRVNDLQSIQYQVINYWQQKEELPKDLSFLSNPISSYYVPVDPEFEKGYIYEYAQKDKMSFELCATFSEQMPKGWQENGGGFQTFDVAKSVAMPSPRGINDSWYHEKGRTCFTRIIDKDIYPPFEKKQ